MRILYSFLLFSACVFAQVVTPPFNGGGGSSPVGGAVGGASNLTMPGDFVTVSSSGIVTQITPALAGLPTLFICSGCDPTGATPSTTAWQTTINAAISANVGAEIHCNPGTYQISSSLTFTSVSGLVFAGGGSQCNFTWSGNTTTPLFLLSDAAFVTLRDFAVNTTASNFLAEVVRTENGAGSTVSPTHNSFRNLVMQGGNGGIGICFRQSASGTGGDNNNDFTTYEGNLCANYTVAGFTIEGTQQSGDVFINNECDSFGRAPYCVSGGASTATAAFFTWIGGFIAQATAADFFVGTSVGGDTTSIIGVHSETSDRAIVTNGPTGALQPLYVSGYSFYSNGLDADGIAVQIEGPGPIEIHDSKFGSDYTKAVKMHWSYVGGGSSPSYQITGTTIYGSLSTRATIFDNLQPTFVSGSAAQTADATFTSLDSINGLRTITVPGANTIGDAYQLYNITAASASNQQYSPATHWQGQGWKTTSTAASQPVDFRAYVVPTQGTTNPSGLFTIDESVNGGSYNPVIQFDARTQTALVANQNSESVPAIGFVGNLVTGWGIRSSALMSIISSVPYTATYANGLGLQANVQLNWTNGSPLSGTQQTTLYQASSGVVGFGTSTNNLLGSWTALNGTLGGTSSAALYATATNCANGASPAVCSAAAAGAVAIPTGTNPTLVVNTTAVTANSRIHLQVDDTVTIGGITCNSTLATLVGGVAITARTAATSFTISYNGVITTNPVCVSYWIEN